MTLEPGWYQEGKVTFQVDKAFYRPHSQVGRDLAVLAAAVYRQQHGELRVLDAMTGCGVRPLRYQVEAGADWVWANEGNPELREVVTQNLSEGMRPRSYRITHQDANQVFFDCYQQRDFYDLVDIDNFGSPTPYLNTGLWATKMGGLLYLTSADGRTTGGHDPDRSLQVYAAYARSHPAVHEQGLRLIIGAILQQAASRGMQIQPVFSIFNGQIHRVMVRLVMDQPWNSQNYGFLGYCHTCGHYETVHWRHIGRTNCFCQTIISGLDKLNTLTLSGPMWLGPLHDVEMLKQMEDLAKRWEWHKRVKLLQIMQDEATMPPYFFKLGEIGRHGKMDIPQRDQLIRALQDHGYQACLTHLDFQAIKTNATFATCIEIARQCQ